jgi:hypothetical protein
MISEVVAKEFSQTTSIRKRNRFSDHPLTIGAITEGAADGITICDENVAIADVGILVSDDIMMLFWMSLITSAVAET